MNRYVQDGWGHACVYVSLFYAIDISLIRCREVASPKIVSVVSARLSLLVVGSVSA